MSVEEKLKKKPGAFYIEKLDAGFALEQARWIKNNIPLFEEANGSGKFYSNYKTYSFWHDSQIPIIRQFVDAIFSKRDSFKKTFERDITLSSIYMSYVERGDEEICVWHKDGYWWNGQFHLCILGNSNILIKDESLQMHVQAEAGTVWYLNSTEYYHKILSSWPGERFELLAPCNYREDCTARRIQGVTAGPERWMDRNHPAIIEDTRIAVEYMKQSFSAGKASSNRVADWTSIK